MVLWCAAALIMVGNPARAETESPQGAVHPGFPIHTAVKPFPLTPSSSHFMPLSHSPTIMQAPRAVMHARAMTPAAASLPPTETITPPAPPTRSDHKDTTVAMTNDEAKQILSLFRTN